MTALTDFYRFVLPHAEGAADIAVSNALRQAAIEFCTRTNLWTETLDRIPVIAGVSDYDLESNEDAEINEVLEVYFENRQLNPRSTDQLKAMFSGWIEMEGTPGYYMRPEPTLLRVIPVPDKDSQDGLLVRVSLRPTMTANELPDFLFTNHAQELAWGALAQLLLEADRAYTSPARAEFFARRFEAAKSRGLAKWNRGDVRAPLTVRYVRI